MPLEGFAPALGVLAVLSIYFGNLTAIRQRRFRRRWPRHRVAVAPDRSRPGGVTFPAADHMDVKLRAPVKPEPAKSPRLPKADPAASALWRVSGYRLTLGNLDTSHVTHIAAISLTRANAKVCSRLAAIDDR